MGQEISPYESLLKEDLEISKTTQIIAIALSYPPGLYGQIQTYFILHMHESLKTIGMKILRGKNQIWGCLLTIAELRSRDRQPSFQTSEKPCLPNCVRMNNAWRMSLKVDSDVHEHIHTHTSAYTCTHTILNHNWKSILSCTATVIIWKD